MKCEFCGEGLSQKPRERPHNFRRRRFCGPGCWGRQNTLSPEAAKSRFWAKVTRSEGCWEWGGYRDHFGYGKVHAGKPRQHITAHRFSWLLAHGPISADVCVLHRCDNPPCVRPDHLFLGTRADNQRDMAEKGRAYRRPFPERCARGHAFTPENTYTNPTRGKRCCRSCSRAARLDFRARQVVAG